MLTFEIVQLHQQVRQAPVGQFFGSDITGQWVDLGRGLLGLGGVDGFGLAGLGFSHDVLDGVGVGKLLGQQHDDARHLRATRRPKIAGLVGINELDASPSSDQRFGVVMVFVRVEPFQLRFQVAHLVLQVNDVVTIDVLALGRVPVFTCRVRSFARPAAGQSRVASCLPLHSMYQYP